MALFAGLLVLHFGCGPGRPKRLGNSTFSNSPDPLGIEITCYCVDTASFTCCAALRFRGFLEASYSATKNTPLCV
jgi:hypothetical protein